MVFGDNTDWTLVDFRAAPPPSPELIADYFYQLQIYALGWRALTGKLLPRGRFPAEFGENRFTCRWDEEAFQAVEISLSGPGLPPLMAGPKNG